MAQRISQLPNEAIPYAQEALGMSSLKRGLGMMNNPNAGMKNQMDGVHSVSPTPTAKQRNAELAIQNAAERHLCSPQANAQAAGQVRKLTGKL